MKHQKIKFGNSRKTYKELRVNYDHEDTHKGLRKNKVYDKRLEHALKSKDVNQLMKLEEEF
jgi:hypothetical protein